MPTKDGATAYSLVDQKSKLKVQLLPENILGRESGLKTETMSRRHCQIVTKEHRWFLADLDSTNGTYLNGKKIKPREWYSMKVGDEVEFGSMVFNFAGPVSKAEANFEKPRADTVSAALPRDGQATSRTKLPARDEGAEPAAAVEPAGMLNSAGLPIRLGSALIDFALMSVISLAVITLFKLNILWALSVPWLSLIAVILMPMKIRGQSLGKIALGLKVVAADGHAPSLITIILREAIGKFAVLVLFPAAGAAILWPVSRGLSLVCSIGAIVIVALLYQRQGETLWDLAIGTRVINLAPPEEE